MFFALIDRELQATIHLIRSTSVGLLDNSRPSFPDLIQPLPWALFELSVSLLTLPQVLSVSTDTASMCRFPPTVFSDVSLTTAIKTTITAFTLGTGNLSGIEHLLAIWPNLLHLLHVKGGPLAAEGDLSFTERIALSSSSEISIA